MIEGLRDRVLTRAILITTGLVVVSALLLALFGAGAQLSPRPVSIVVRLWQMSPEIAAQIHVGDPAFTDVALVPIGTITRVDSYPQPRITIDSSGRVHSEGDVTQRRVDVTISGVGRVADDLVIVHTQAILDGRSFSLLSNRYYLAGTVVSVDAR